jgi:hypothetical protein
MGIYDLIKAEAESEARLREDVIREIRAISGVRSTTTMIVFKPNALSAASRALQNFGRTSLSTFCRQAIVEQSGKDSHECSHKDDSGCDDYRSLYAHDYRPSFEGCFKGSTSSFVKLQVTLLQMFAAICTFILHHGYSTAVDEQPSCRI